MSIFINDPKERCSVCGKKFYPKFCISCRQKVHMLCKACHERSQFHKRENSKLHA